MILKKNEKEVVLTPMQSALFSEFEYENRIIFVGKN